MLYGAMFGVFGSLLAASPWLPAIGMTISHGPDAAVTAGLAAVASGMLIFALGACVLSGAAWARVTVMVLSGTIALYMYSLIVFPLVAIIASVLQFLPSVSRYVAATSS